MKSQLLLTLSLYAFSSFSAIATSTQCTDAEKQQNIANTQIMLLTSFNGPVKSVMMTSTLPNDGRFKAFKGKFSLMNVESAER
ncbi:hypothetical protein AB6H17_19065 [Proteus vulgaris]|uniref:hypothetical protein n=1 Tax=Proteus vulgaris TaxID=585 RepID=UPI0034DD9B95